MKKEQQFLHFVSVLVAAFGVLVFFLLGGGTGDAATAEAFQEQASQDGLNLTVPEPDAEELSANRLEAVLRKAEVESDQQRTQKMQQASSFQWTGLKQEEVPDTMVNVASSVPSFSSSPPASPPKVEEASIVDRQAFIAETRKNLARKYGVELPENDSESTSALPPVPHAAGKAASTSSASRVAIANTSTPGFYGLERKALPPSDIRAVVHGEHRNLERGAIVKLRLLDAVVINETMIPANTFLYGQLSFASCRAMIRIENVQYQQVVYPFEGTIFDKDGFEGLYVPDNRIDEATRKAGSQALGNVNLRIPGASFLSSAANAAVGAVQSVAQQAVGQQKINISSNYLVTIKQTSR